MILMNEELDVVYCVDKKGKNNITKKSLTGENNEI